MNTKRKAANGEGTIAEHPDGKRYRAVISLGLVDGKRKRQVGAWRTTKRDANQDRRRLLQARDEGRSVRTRTMTLAQFVDQWLEDVIKPTVRYASYRAYRARLHSGILPTLGTRPLDKITPGEVQTVLTRMAMGGYSTHAVRSTRNALITALNVALEWGLIDRNPAKATKVAAIEERSVPVLTQHDIARLLLHAIGTVAHPAIYLGLLGLRNGEVCALQWGDVDWERRTLSVHGTRVYVPGGLCTGPTKTPHSKRVIPLPDEAIQALRDWQELQQEQRQWAAATWEETGTLLTNRLGRPHNPQTIKASVDASLVAAEMPPMRFHDFRHVAASLMSAAGVPLKAQMAYLGHARPSMTLDYTHVGEADTRQAADVLGRILRPSEDAW